MQWLSKFILCIAALVVAMSCFAENPAGLMLSPQTSEIITPTPSSAQQIRYQSPQPSLATGAVNLSIPLYTIEAEDLSIPFSLSYHTSGIKPADDPYPCGYGWSMLPALKITRTVRGRADELFDYWGDKFSIASQPDPKLPYACMVATVYPDKFYKEEFTNRYDPEKDIFTISLPSGTYKRIYQKDYDGNISFIGGGADDEIVVTANEGLNDFYVHDSNGFVYHFGRGTDDASVEIIQSEHYYTSNTPTCWGIIDITLPSGRTIDFTWRRYGPAIKEFFGGEIFCDQFEYVNGMANDMSESEKMKAASWNSVPISVNGNYHHRIALSSVSFPGGTISLNYSGKKLDRFTAVTASDTVRTIQLSYGEGAVESLFLKSVSVSGEGTYSFEYDPQRFEDNNAKYRQDWWGYYNGLKPFPQPNSGNLSPYLKFRAHYYGGPKGLDTTTDTGSFGHADRSVNETAMQAGILKKIIYPTGGYSAFEYETHRFPATKVDSEDNLLPKTDPELDKGGGLRVKKISTYTGEEDQRPHIRTYQYDSVVVTAVPSAATFVSVSDAIGLCYPVFESPRARHYRQLYVNWASDYMQNHIGEEAIWYSQVTELYDEGKIVHRFGYLTDTSEEVRYWGHLYPLSLNNVFTHGVLPFSKEIYKSENGGYKKVATTEYDYETTYTSTIYNTHIQRLIINAAGKLVEQPDFINGRYYLTDSGLFYQINTSDDIIGDYPYELNVYPLELQSDRLKSKTVTQHLENGDFTQTETYEYVPGTSIVKSVSTTNPADGRIDCIELKYPSAENAVEKLMKDANMVGVPVESTHTFGSAKVTISPEMASYGNRVFRPAKEWQWRGEEKWLAGSYRYDSYGNLQEYLGQDSVPSAYLWGYTSLYPVYQIQGCDYSEVSRRNTSAYISNGSAEKAELVMPSDKLSLVTKALWKPAVGISSLRQPNGLTTSYDYDYAGRLIHTSIDDYGPIDRYYYYINYNGLNYTSHGVYISGTASFTDIRDVTHYDGLGREISKVQAVPEAGGYISVYTEYDSMDRPFRQWAPVMLSSRHPTLDAIRSASQSYYNTAHAYQTTFYEPSPAGTVRGSRKAGQEWNTENRNIAVKYLVNKDSGDYCCPDCYSSSSSRYVYTDKRNYPAGALTIEEVTDEEGHVNMTFRDVRGKTVLVREGVPGDWNDTRYVYNDYGDLLYVIQPQSKGSVLKQSCFRYEYDSRGNCTLKALPNITQNRYRYDSRNRLFAEQDGNMQNSGLWLIHHYDVLGRPAFSAYATVANADITTLSKKSFTVAAPVAGKSLATATGGYVCPEDLTAKLTYIELAEVHYYDSYDYVGGLNGGWQSFLSSGTPHSNRTLGLETATAAGSHIRMKVFDNIGRVIREAYGEISQEPESESSYVYDYEGRIVSQTDVARGSETITRNTSNTYYRSGRLHSTTVTQSERTAAITYSYDKSGKLAKVEFGDNISQVFSYNANGWMTSNTATATRELQVLPQDSIRPVLKVASNPIKTILEEKLYYADTADAGVPRYDGKISVRRNGSLLIAYDYDNHGRLASSQTSMADHPTWNLTDYSTAYTYDRNANITSISRQGIVSRVGNLNTFGHHSRYDIGYASNKIVSMQISRDGEDYEGRTGPGETGNIRNFSYDPNGNLSKDPSRGIVSTNFNRLNLPTDIYFSNGHRQTITYDGFGQKRSVVYSQTTDPMLVATTAVPDDSAYTVLSSRKYLGSHVFVGDSLEYSAFPGGYFTPEGTYYYITDWQGNNKAVFSSKGNFVQQTNYYPYGEPTVEPKGQRYLFGGKEREHAGGCNTYDFGARSLTPYGLWSTPDPKAEKFRNHSPYIFCGGDPINHVDRDGQIWDGIWDAAVLTYDVVAAAYYHVKVDHKQAKSHWVDAGSDLIALAIPGVPAGLTKVGSAVMAAGGGKLLLAAAPLATKVENAIKSHRNLRKALGLAGECEAHHIIPIKILKRNNVVQEAVNAGFDFNGVLNGIKAKRHHGSHPNYTKMINTEISTWAEDHPNYTAKEAKNFIEELSEKLKKQIENGEIKVN